MLTRLLIRLLIRCVLNVCLLGSVSMGRAADNFLQECCTNESFFCLNSHGIEAQYKIGSYGGNYVNDDVVISTYSERNPVFKHERPKTKTNQDRLLVKKIDQIADVQGNWIFFGVFDGHGKEAGDVLANFVMNNITSIVEQTGLSVVTCERMNHMIFKHFSQEQFAKNYTAYSSGTTATMGLLNLDTMHITVANIGDSQTVIATQDGVIKLVTMGHTGENQDEIERIKAAGGNLSSSGRLHCGEAISLAPTRSFGDFIFGGDAYKIGSIARLVTPGLICTPDIYEQDLDSGDMIIFASDGIWDRFEPEEAIAFVADVASEGEAMSESLVTEAREKDCEHFGINCDDLTAIVVHIK